MFQKRVVAALDLGGYSLKYVEVDVENATVRRMWQREFHPERTSAKEVVGDEQFQRRVGELLVALQAEGPLPPRIVTALQGDGTWLQYLEFPHLSPSELQVAAQAAACKTIPFSLDQVVFTTVPVPALKGTNRSGAMVVAALRKPAEALSHMLAGCGAYVNRMEVVPLALVREFATNHPERAGESVALVNVGFTFTHVVVTRGGFPYLVREFPLGGRHFTYGVQMARRVTWREADEERRRSDSTERDAAYEPFVRDWLEEIRQSISTFDAQIAGPRSGVSRVFFAGGCSAWKGLRERLEESLGLPVAADTWERIRCVGSNAGGEAPGAWKAAVGMALEP